MNYEQFKIKEYNMWDLFMHVNQHSYLGRCYAWAHREDAKGFFDMNKEEFDELAHVVFVEWKRAVNTIFKNSWENIGVFGNATDHLHVHFIPRYREDRYFYETVFIDTNPVGTHGSFENGQLSCDVLMCIRNDLEKFVNSEK